MLQPETVKRDQFGYWFHSAIRDTPEDTPIHDLPVAEGMEFEYISFDSDAPDELQERYFSLDLEDDDPPPVSLWNPAPPEGDKWFLLAIYDTEDGPYACFTRPKTEGAAAA